MRRTARHFARRFAIAAALAISYLPALALRVFRLAASATRQAYEDPSRFVLYAIGGAVIGAISGVFVWAFSTTLFGVAASVALFALVGGWILTIARWLLSALVHRWRGRDP